MREISKKEVKMLKNLLKEFLPSDFLNNLTSVFEIEYKENFYYYTCKKDKDVFAIKYNNIIFPSLNILWKLKIRPSKNYIIVDKGAIKPILNGADIMRPGIKEINNIEKDKLCFILEEVNLTPIAIGYALYSEEEIKNMEKGKCIKNIHYINDKIWKIDF